ncbi:four helix bundle protein [Prevotella sp. P6B4]|uniref:four helix bundle protein n=1 Tax=Prevotella sp. P6B4 TaxID=1410614 RepID=UPI00048DB993|nr:four helix bundle protein [Prevotella sp. P6B4]
MLKGSVENDIYIIARNFALRVIKLYEFLKTEKKEFIMSKQIFRSGTSIGANVFEGKNAQSRADFSSKMNIALKEATETGYWLDLLHEANCLDDNLFESLNDECSKIIAILTKIVKATKE